MLIVVHFHFPRIPLLHSDLEVGIEHERRRTFSAQIVWPLKVEDEGVYPFPEDAEDGLLLSLKLAGDGISQEIHLAPVEKFPAEDIVEHTIAIESNEDVLAFCCDEDWGGVNRFRSCKVIAVAAFSGSKISLKQRHEHYANPIFS